MTRTSGPLGWLVAATLLASSACPTLAPAQTAPTQTVSFIARRDFEAGTYPHSVAVADFNGDGVQDLAVVGIALSNDVSVLLGNGDGTFRAPISVPVGSDQLSVVVGDFNGDGVPDLAVGRLDSDNNISLPGIVSVSLGNGDGTFQPPVNYTVGVYPWSVAVGDLNRDGTLDLVVANAGDNDVSILLGNGDGTFGTPANVPVGQDPFSVVVGDFNGDGVLDLAVANSIDNDASILLGNGDGTFQAAVTFAVGTSPRSLAVGDFNGDGTLDLAVANEGDNNASILLGNGEGTFRPPTTFAAGIVPVFVVVGDFNGDGKPDLGVANSAYCCTCPNPRVCGRVPGGVSVLLGNGDGTFRAAQSVVAGGSPGSGSS